MWTMTEARREQSRSRDSRGGHENINKQVILGQGVVGGGREPGVKPCWEVMGYKVGKL